MNKKELFVANALMIIFILFAANYTMQMFSRVSFDFARKQIKKEVYNKVLETNSVSPSIAVAAQEVKCSKQEPLKIDVGSDPNLRQLQSYQDLCDSFATNKLMIFIDFPSDEKSAQENAAYVSKKISDFQKNGVQPIVIVEPYVGDKLMSYKDFLAGKYDSAIESYFKNIKKAGVSDEAMGTWVPFPEPNTPNWENKDTDPSDFALCVNKYLAGLKKYFPNAKGSILLSAITYEPTDTQWNNGDYLNLTPYLQDIDKSLIDSFGIQGFPWISNAKAQRREIFRASEFLQPDLAISAAQELRTKDIWINTGTFATKYANDSEKVRTTSISDRKGILGEILDVAKGIQDYQLNEYRVSINLFAEDKSQAEEATDWSYFQTEDSGLILKEFMKRAEELQIPVSISDIAHAK